MLSFIGFWIAKFLAEVLLFVAFLLLLFVWFFISVWLEQRKYKKERNHKT